MLGLGTWVQEVVSPRDGELRIPPLGFAVIARDFWVAKDLGAISTLIETARAPVTGVTLGEFNGTVRSGATPLPNARVVFEGPSARAVFFTGADGTFTGKLPVRAYQVSAWVAGPPAHGEAERHPLPFARRASRSTSIPPGASR